MAFESLNKYTETLAAEYQKKENISYLFSLVWYYETVLSNPKFKSQRQFCKETILAINPSFYEGYFKISKSKNKK